MEGFTAKMKESLEGMLSSIAPKLASPFAPLYSNINQQVSANLGRLTLPPINPLPISRPRVIQRERDRELHAP